MDYAPRKASATELEREVLRLREENAKLQNIVDSFAHAAPQVDADREELRRLREAEAN